MIKAITALCFLFATSTATILNRRFLRQGALAGTMLNDSKFGKLTLQAIDIIADDKDPKNGYQVSIDWADAKGGFSFAPEDLRETIQGFVTPYIVSEEILKSAADQLNASKKAEIFVEAVVSYPKIEPVVLSNQSKNEVTLGEVVEYKNSEEYILANKGSSKKQTAEIGVGTDNTPHEEVFIQNAPQLIDPVAYEKTASGCDFNNKMVITIEMENKDALAEKSCDYQVQVMGKFQDSLNSDRVVSKEMVNECLKLASQKVILSDSQVTQIVENLEGAKDFGLIFMQTKPIYFEVKEDNKRNKSTQTNPQDQNKF